MFDLQRQVFEGGHSFFALQCGRRGGKTDLAARKLVDMQMANPSAAVLYITLTEHHSVRNMERALDDLIERHGLPLKKQKSPFQYVHPQGGRIWLTGCKDAREAEKYRGDKYGGAIIDEAGSFPDTVLRYLVQSVLQPALSDLKGQLWLVGSPGLVPLGYWYDINSGEGDVPQWPRAEWTCLDNPYWRPDDKEAALEEVRELNGWDAKSETYLREWMNRWVKDLSALIYNYEGPGFTELPAKDGWHTHLAIDLGYNDDAAFVVGSWRPGHPQIYLREAYGEPGMLLTDIRDHARALIDRYGVSRVVIDQGGLGKTIAQSLAHQYGISNEPAEKRDKPAAIRQVRDMLRRWYLPVHEERCRQLLEEWRVLQWDEDRLSHAEGMADHCADAVLYLVRSFVGLQVKSGEPEVAAARVTEGDRWRREMLRKAAMRGQSGRYWRR